MNERIRILLVTICPWAVLVLGPLVELLSSRLDYTLLLYVRIPHSDGLNGARSRRLVAAMLSKAGRAGPVSCPLAPEVGLAER